MDAKVLNNRFRLEALVGQGGMATVYRGHDLLLERPVAVKVLREPYASDADFRARFLEEARAAGRLEHTNIVHIYDVGTQDGQPYIVMEMVPGEDLKTLIRRESPLSLTRSLDIARQICAGVGHAHRHGLVHCDLKPHNILLTPEGKVKVADFGIARAFHDESPSGERQRIIWGSPHYISPEQAAGEPPTPASDVYSIGVILYELLTGVPPFHAEDTTALILKHLREKPAPPSSLNPKVPPHLDLLVERILAKVGSERYSDGNRLHDVLEEYLQALEAPREYPEEGAVTRKLETVPPPPTPATPAPPQEQTPSTPEAQSETDAQTPDRLLWALMIVAALAVLGLIPLWLHVYRSYTQTVTPQPTGIATVTPTPTPTGEQVPVPNFVGLSASEARQLAERYNLGLVVTDERETEEFLPGTVLSQSPESGSQVTTEATIEVVVAAGRAFILPDLVGYQRNVVLPNLQMQGLLIVEEEVWSTEPRGRILAQEPEPETEVRAGETLTLTVSGGIERNISLQVNLNQQVMLEEALVLQRPLRPGNTLPVTLRWRALRPLDRSYLVFVHLLTNDMQTLITQDDGVPANGTNPTNTWRPGEIIVDPHQLTIPPNTPAGTYQVRVGLYTEAEGRLQVIDSGATEVVENSIFVTQVEVEP